jgi:hypothetical protein
VGARSARTAGYNAWDVWTHGSLDRVDARTAGWRVEGCERGKTPARVVASECVVTRMLRPAVPRAARLLRGVMSVADLLPHYNRQAERRGAKPPQASGGIV